MAFNRESLWTSQWNTYSGRKAGHLVISSSNKYCFEQYLLYSHPQEFFPYAFQKNKYSKSTEVETTSLLWLCLHFVICIYFDTVSRCTFHCSLEFCHNHELKPLSRTGPNPRLWINDMNPASQDMTERTVEEGVKQMEKLWHASFWVHVNMNRLNPLMWFTVVGCMTIWFVRLMYLN